MMINQKRVNIYTTVPLFIGNTIVRGNVFDVTLSLAAIRACILGTAAIDEILDDGTTLRLNLGNYDADNNVKPEDAVIIEPEQPVEQVETPVETEVEVQEPELELEQQVEQEPQSEVQVEEDPVQAEPVEAEPELTKEQQEEAELLAQLEAEEVEKKDSDSDAELLAQLEAEEKALNEKNKKKHRK